LLALTVGLVGISIGLYRHETCIETHRLLLKAVVSTLVSLTAVWLVGKITHINLDGLFGGNGWSVAMLPAVTLVTWAGLLLMTRLLYNTALRRNMLIRRVLVLATTPALSHNIEMMVGRRRGLFRVEVADPTAGLLQSNSQLGLTTHLHPAIWGVVYDRPPAPAGLPAGVRSFDAESFWEYQLGRVDISATAQRCDAAPLSARSTATDRVMAAAVRRGMDIILSALMLLVTAPLLLVTALLIAIESPGPVIYRQERVGLGGKSFTIWKFRSMRNDAERAGPIWAAVGDARVTRVGSFIRKVRIDELPQLFNILRGDMSLVGPRPERPHFVEQLAAVIPRFHERAHVKPGLTGWAQVNYPYGASIEDARIKLSYDLYYVKHRSLAFDLLILLATVRVVLFQEGSR
jgi:lipopolysaccharide/colanic/teichoic acid biosynthesis glycosyltransferase